MANDDELDLGVEEDSDTEEIPEMDAEVGVDSDKVDSVGIVTSELDEEDSVASEVVVELKDIAVSKLRVVSEVLVVSEVEAVVSDIVVDGEVVSLVELESVVDVASKLDVEDVVVSDATVGSDDVID